MNKFSRPLGRCAIALLAATAIPLTSPPARADRDIREDRELRTGGGSERSRDDSRDRESRRTADEAARRSRDSGGDTRRSAESAGKASGGGSAKADAAQKDGQKDAQNEAQKNDAKRAEDAAKADADSRKEAAKIAEDAAKAQADAEEDAAKDAEDASREAAKERIESAGRDGGERYLVERGLDGRERLPGEVLVIDRSEAAAAVRAAGYTVRNAQSFGAGREALLRVAVPAGQNIEKTVERLQQLLPTASVAPNHIFRPSQAGASAAAVGPALPNAAAGATPSAAEVRRAIGILDTGVDTRTPGLARAVLRRQAFAGATYIPRAHGTLVAERAMRQGAPLAVADVFGADGDNRLVAPTDAVAGAIAWLMAERVPVINISIEGPDNAVMALLVRRAIESGITVVAAAGNSGPAAAPVYPAAYPGVIAVTAINDRDEVYRRANRGDYISFAAPGVNVVSQAGSYDSQPVSGTSFAAPEVAAVIADRLTRPRADGRMPPPDVVLAELRHAARDLGPTGRDPVYGWGAIPLDPAPAVARPGASSP